MIKHKSFKFRIYPTGEQKVYFSKVFGCCRFIWNAMLEDKIKAYKDTGKFLYNRPAQYKEKFEWLKEVDSYALCNEQMDLQQAYTKFFKGKGKIGFPKYKSKKHDRDSFTTNNVNGVIKLLDNNKYIKFCKVKKLRIKCHRQMPSNYKIKNITISRTPTNKYYCSILTEYECTENNKEIDVTKAIGLDYSSTYFYVDSQGKKANYPKFYRLYQDKLAREQRKLSHMKLGSNNYRKQKIKIAIIYEKITNCRVDWIEKLSRKFANIFDVVCIENLDMIDIVHSLKLAKSTLDNSWGRFVTKLEQKCKLVLKCDKFFPSSKTCHYCGYVNKDLTIKDRKWECPNCHTIIDRDENSANNILTYCLKTVVNL